MIRPQLLQWQWEGYPTFHQTRLTLLIHIVAVPAFVVGGAHLVLSVVIGQWLFAAVSSVWMALAFGAQGFTHKREPNSPIPFDGPLDALSRIVAENFITFPRFVFSGGWLKALRGASR